MSLELPTEGEGGGRMTSQEFRDLCRKFDGGLEERVVEAAYWSDHRPIGRED